jgi:hypothetical protein
MANETNDKKPVLADEREAAIKVASDEYNKLSPEEKKKYRAAEDNLQKRMDITNYY